MDLEWSPWTEAGWTVSIEHESYRNRLGSSAVSRRYPHDRMGDPPWIDYNPPQKEVKVNNAGLSLLFSLFKQSKADLLLKLALKVIRTLKLAN